MSKRTNFGSAAFASATTLSQYALKSAGLAVSGAIVDVAYPKVVTSDFTAPDSFTAQVTV